MQFSLGRPSRVLLAASSTAWTGTHHHITVWGTASALPYITFISMSAQEITLAIAPKVGGLLSVIGSSWILLEVSGSPKKRKGVYHRMMFMISFFDIIVSSAAFASTWSMTPEPAGEEPWRAIGNAVTCTAQGFALQLGATLFCYNAFLSIFFVLVINCSVSEATLKKREWALHIFPILFGLTTATVPAALGWYHNASLWCWLGTDPDCLDDNDSAYCEKFDTVMTFRWIFFFGPLWICFAIEMVCLFVVFKSVRRQEHQSRRYNKQATIVEVTAEAESESPASTPARQNIFQDLPRTRQVATQAVLYILAFYNTYIFATINRILQQSNGSSPFAILMLHSLSLPMQGFWNFLIYRRPFYLLLRRSKSMPRWEAIKTSLILSWFKGPNNQYTTGTGATSRVVSTGL
jgi:hypothetical protein